MLKSKTIIAVMVLSTLYSIGVGLLGPVYPIFVVNRFAASVLDIGFLYAVFGVVTALFQIIAGKLADSYGKEHIFFLGVMMGALCSLSYICASSLEQLYIIEFMFGISYAMQRPSLLAFMIELSDRKSRSTVLGMFESIYEMIEALAALLATIIISQVGFETLFFICSGCQATTGIVILKYKR
ncbi:MFS transporter [Candidatus Bathyarchaeota archaeon]|nr:MFS transporter [Candidatus Bathyarchaeota archaeon]